MTILWPNILGHQQRALNSLLTTIPNRNYRSDRPGGLILYCTALFCTVLYKKRRMKEGLEWTQFLKRLCVLCLFFVIKFSNFSLFHPSLIIQYSTEECSTVQYKAAGHRTHKTSLRVKKTIPESMPCIVAHSTRRYIGTAVGPLHPALHRNGA